MNKQKLIMEIYLNNVNRRVIKLINSFNLSDEECLCIYKKYVLEKTWEYKDIEKYLKENKEK